MYCDVRYYDSSIAPTNQQLDWRSVHFWIFFQDIHKKIMTLDFNDCHAKIRQVDSQATVDQAVVVQVNIYFSS